MENKDCGKMEWHPNAKSLNWEKAGVYLAIAATFFTVIIYIADMKERIAKLEVKVEKLEEKK